MNPKEFKKLNEWINRTIIEKYGDYITDCECGDCDDCDREREFMPRGRPRKNQNGLENVTITPVANGYILTSKTTGSEQFVFPDLDSLFEFVRAKLAPTKEQSDFLQGV